MKNLLLISFYFNQKNEIASKRLRSLSKHLPKYGWNPIVITPHFDDIDTSFNKTELKNIEIIETEYVDMLDKYKSLLNFNKSKKINDKSLKSNNTKSNKDNLDFENDNNKSSKDTNINFENNNDKASNDTNINFENNNDKASKDTNIKTNIKTNHPTNVKPNPLIQKGIHLAGEIFAYPDGMKYWYKPGFEASENIIKERKIEAILSSSWPISCHTIAKDLSEKYNIPWIGDLRDLWNKNPYVNHNFIRRHFEYKLELKTFKNVSALTVTTPLTKEILSTIHPDKKIYTIENGYEKSEFENIEPVRKSEGKLNITYAGKLYEGKRDPQILFEAIENLSNNNLIDKNKIELNFYGDSGNILEIGEKYNIKDIINVHGFIDHNEVLKEEKSSDILLLISWNNPNERIFIPGKVFEYMALKKPVISIGYKEGCLKDIIDQTNIGFHTDNLKSCMEGLLKYYNEFIENDYKLEYNGNEEVNNYTTENMALKFAKILEGL